MPLPLLLIPIAVTVGSAAAQAVGKLRGRSELNKLREQLAESRSRHRHLLTEYFLRQSYLCTQLGLELPAKPEALLPPSPPDEAEVSRRPLWRRVLPMKKKTTLTQGSTGSARQIVGRHSASAVSSVVWKTSSANIMRIVQPISARLLQLVQPLVGRLAVFVPRLAIFGGGAASTGGSVAASSVARMAIGAFSVVGIIIGPATVVWTIYSEIRKIRRARLELRLLQGDHERELASFRVRNRRLEARYAEILETPVEERELVAAG